MAFQETERRKGDNRMIYLDMDGVLAHFDKGVNDLCGMKATSQNKKYDRQHDDRMWEAIRKVDHFYDRLELMPGAKEMFDTIYGRYGDQCEILTGIPRPFRGIDTAGEDKIAWTRRMLSDKVKINIVYRKEKREHCTGPQDILIDDRVDTIREWEKQGGTGILHHSAEETLAKLRELGLL